MPLSQLVILFFLSYIISYILFGSIIWLEIKYGPQHQIYSGVDTIEQAIYFAAFTMTTVGYGNQYPDATHTGWPSLTPVLAVLCSLLMDCFWIGLIYSSIAQPRSLKRSILFSALAVMRPVAVDRLEGMPYVAAGSRCIQLRVINLRGTEFQTVDPSLRLYFAKWDIEENFLRFHQLKIENSIMPFMTLPWTITHVIDERSALWGETPSSLQQTGGEIIAVWEGTDPISGSQVRYNHSYIGEEVIAGHKLADVVSYGIDGFLEVDVAKFHDTVEDGTKDFFAQSLDVEWTARV